MAILSDGLMAYPGITLDASASQTALLDATGGYAGCCFVAPYACTIKKIGVYVTAITGNPPPYKVGVYARYDATVYSRPDWATVHEEVDYDFTATGWHWITLPNGVAITADADTFTLGIREGASAPDANNNVTLYIGQRLASWDNSKVCTWAGVRYVGGTLVQASASGIVFEDSNGIRPFPAMQATAQYRFRSGDTPDEVGLRITVPFACKVRGFTGAAYIDDSKYKARLYGPDGSVVYSETVDSTHNADVVHEGVLASDLSLATGQSVRITWQSDDASNYTTINVITPDSAADIVAAQRDLGLSPVCYRTDEGAWTDSTTEFTGRATLLLSEITLEYSNDPAPATIESGCPGDTITITGAYFGDTEGTVTFGALPATIVSWAADSIDVIIPVGATDCNVTVTKADAKTGVIAFTQADDCGGPATGAILRMPEVPIHTDNPIGAGPNIGLSPVR